MTDHRADWDHDVVAIGNALVDVLSHEEEAFISAEGLNKGAMTLINESRAQTLYDSMGPGIEISGGCAANTVVGVAAFGGTAAYIGRVADDQLGTVFAHNIQSTGVDYAVLPASGGSSTGRCLIVVTPDAQRTMSTFLGASNEMHPGQVDLELIRNASQVYLEGYLWDPPEAKEAMLLAAKAANSVGSMVSLTLSDSFCVERHRESFRSLIADHVQLLFANELEIKALYETDDLDSAIRQVGEGVDIAAVTLGRNGSLVVANGEAIRVKAVEVPRRVDTTGAGDLYAAGFLFGLARGYDLSICGQLGSAAASEVITHMGARPQTDLAAIAEKILS
ncbi:MAG: adenosine kinase [Acidimicrobiales bacterium]